MLFLMKNILFLLIIAGQISCAQSTVNLGRFNRAGEAKVIINKQLLKVSWPSEDNEQGEIVFDLSNEKSLFKNFRSSRFSTMKEIGIDLDPVFLLTIGKRDLISQNGWNIFFDKTSKLPHTTYSVQLSKKSTSVSTSGSRTIVQIGDLKGGPFNGVIEVTLKNGSL